MSILSCGRERRSFCANIAITDDVTRFTGSPGMPYGKHPDAGRHFTPPLARNHIWAVLVRWIDAYRLGTAEFLYRDVVGPGGFPCIVWHIAAHYRLFMGTFVGWPGRCIGF